MSSYPDYAPNTDPATPLEAARGDAEVAQTVQASPPTDAFGLRSPQEPPNTPTNAPVVEEKTGPTIESAEFDGLLVSDGKTVGITIHVKRTGQKYLVALPITAEIDNTGF